MKKILAMAAVAALAGSVSAFAANPFSDVSTSDWAYQAVSTLSDQGVVEGYPDGTFKGQNNITRYEMAQIVARLMAKEDQLNAEQRAAVDKLASEFADELDSLGVRVGNLEKKVGNISWSGDARMRYQSTGAKASDAYNGRIRLNVKGQVNDNTAVYGRLNSTADLKAGSDADTVADRVYVQHDFGDAVTAKLGRYELDLGQQVSWLYANAVDGAELKAALGDKVTVAAGYGRLRDAKDVQGTYSTANADHQVLSGFNDAEVFYAQGKADLGAAKLGVDYYKTSNYDVNDQWKDGTGKWHNSTFAGAQSKEKSEVYGVNLLIPAGKARVFGDYYKETAVQGDPTIWTAGIGYGKADLKKPGTFNLDVAYFDVDAGLYHTGMTGWQLGDDLLNQDGSFYVASGDVTLAKNTYLHAEYAFGYSAGNKAEADQDDQWTVSMNYKF